MRTKTWSTRRPKLTFAVMALAALAAAPRPTEAQTGPDLIRRAIAAQAERLAGVDNVTLTQSLMGMDVTLYMETRDVGGFQRWCP